MSDATDQPQGTAVPGAERPERTEVATFGAGCFWKPEALYREVPGVVDTAVGYEGGHVADPSYEQVCSGTTGHAEVVRVTYDPAKVSYEMLLKTFWENHDPTQGMRQGNDRGTQYRSAIYANDEQLPLAKASIEMYQARLTEAGFGEITTELRPAADAPFFYAEDYHQQYLSKDSNGYCGAGHTGVSCPIGIL